MFEHCSFRFIECKDAASKIVKYAIDLKHVTWKTFFPLQILETTQCIRVVALVVNGCKASTINTYTSLLISGEKKTAPHGFFFPPPVNSCTVEYMDLVMRSGSCRVESLK